MKKKAKPDFNTHQFFLPVLNRIFVQLMIKKNFLLSIFLVCATMLLAQVVSAQSSAEVAAEGPMHAIGLGIILIAFSLVFFAVCAALLILILSAVAIFLALAAAGIVSVATLYGFQKRSFSAGFKALLWLVIPATAAVTGWVVLCLSDAAFDWQISSDYKILIGVGGGLLSGALLTVLLLRIGQLLLRKMMQWWPSAKFNQ